MKTIQSIKAEITAVHQDIQKKESESKIFATTADKSRYSKSKREIKRLKGKLPQLKYFSLYLETTPTEDFLNKEHARINNRVQLLMQTYKPLDGTRFRSSEITKHKKDFEKEMGIPKLRKQLSAISYLLK